MRIGIIGCGVAGQAAAIALARGGHDVTVFERFASARPIGAGLLLQPSGQAALERLGLRKEAEQWGAPVQSLDGYNVRGGHVLQMDYRKGEHGLGIHRGGLFDILHRAVLASGATLKLGFDVERIETPDMPFVVSRTGERAGPFDVLLDCAGAHDALRNSLGLRVRAPIYPWGAVWAALPDRTNAFRDVLRQMYDGAHMMVGILPLGRAPGAAFDGNMVAFFWSLKTADYETQRAAGIDALKARVRMAWPESTPIVDELKQWEELTFATYRDVSVKPLRSGRVVVLGDAAHGTSPQLGQGANLALLDAVTLAHCLRRPNIEDALGRFEAMRRGHVGFYRMASAAMTPFFQSDSRVLAGFRDALLYPSGKIPGMRYAMRTTLGGTRKLPFGLFKIPD